MKLANHYFYNVADYYKAISKEVNKVYKKAQKGKWYQQWDMNDSQETSDWWQGVQTSQATGFYYC